MTAFLCRMILKICGWKFDGVEATVKKAIVLSVPHTSNWDFVWGKLTFMAHRVETYIFLKKEFFFFPMNLLFRALNVLPLNRTDSTGMVKRIVKEFNSREKMYLCITPEGSRSTRDKWPRGFYYIAVKAKVPIYLGWIDYKLKTLSFGELFYPTGNIDEDIRYIKSTYKNRMAKYPEKFSIGDAGDYVGKDD